MKHSLLAALTAVITKPLPILRPLAVERWRSGLARVSKGAWLLVNPRTALEVAQLFASPQLRPVFRTEPRLMFKFLGDYLAADLSRKERASMLIHHYAFLKERVDERFFQSIIDGRLELCPLEAGDCLYRIWLSFPRTPYREGDLSLTFEVDDLELYTLSFTIGPAALAGLSARDAMYIARVQGLGKALDRIRQATRECCDVSPAMLLLAAAEGIAQALDLEHMIGIGACTQVMTKDGVVRENFVKAYDEFWQAVGGSRLDRNLYHLTVPMLGKPILAIKRDHRSRTQRKRRFKKAVKEQVCQAFRAAQCTSGTVPSTGRSLIFPT